MRLDRFSQDGKHVAVAVKSRIEIWEAPNAHQKDFIAWHRVRILGQQAAAITEGKALLLRAHLPTSLNKGNVSNRALQSRALTGATIASGWWPDLKMESLGSSRQPQEKISSLFASVLTSRSIRTSITRQGFPIRESSGRIENTRQAPSYSLVGSFGAGCCPLFFCPAYFK